ncbi:hypothetical protein [Methanosphaera sp.]|uniref:hypothetical protein n=1 Tax=Methanosphaera sp. TaxID=2666342 RepID=UPI003D93682A
MELSNEKTKPKASISTNFLVNSLKLNDGCNTDVALIPAIKKPIANNPMLKY